MRRGLAATVGAALMLVALASGAAAQSIVVLDMDRVLREAAVSQALRSLQERDRRALRAQLDALQRDLEAREEELSALRDALPRAEFDRLVRAFDNRVRDARRSSQAASESLQSRYAEAGRALRASVGPVLDDVMARRGAQLALDRAAALRSAPALDVTDEVIALLDERRPAEAASALLPPAPVIRPPAPRPSFELPGEGGAPPTGFGPADAPSPVDRAAPDAAPSSPE
jgi:outer membrane protein